MKALDVTSTKYGLGNENPLILYSDNGFIALWIKLKNCTCLKGRLSVYFTLLSLFKKNIAGNNLNIFSGWMRMIMM